jgi:hypothetical protein
MSDDSISKLLDDATWKKPHRKPDVIRLLFQISKGMCIDFRVDGRPQD